GAGHGSRFSAPPPGDGVPDGEAPPASERLTNACTSASRMRPFGPLPAIREISAPSSRAYRRTEGDACALRLSDPGLACCEGSVAAGVGAKAAGAPGCARRVPVSALAIAGVARSLLSGCDGGVARLPGS